MGFVKGIVPWGAIITANCIAAFKIMRLLRNHIIATNNAREERLAAIERGEAWRRCGYPHLGLELPRCPECGAMKCFDATLEEPGLSEGELRLLASNRSTKENLTPPNSIE